CGNWSWVDWLPRASCCMNYWLAFVLDDARMRMAIPWTQNRQSADLCAPHLRRMRDYHLEDNPVLGWGTPAYEPPDDRASARHRPMPSLDLTFASGESSLSVSRFRVQEGVSTLFTVSIRALSDDPSIDLDTIVGRAASFQAVTDAAFEPLGGRRRWTGICAHMA